jgi:hypothetical protein
VRYTTVNLYQYVPTTYNQPVPITYNQHVPVVSMYQQNQQVRDLSILQLTYVRALSILQPGMYTACLYCSLRTPSEN